MSVNLPRIDAAGFRQRISTIPLALVLMCIPSHEVCRQLDVQLGGMRETLTAERLPVALRALDLSGTEGAALQEEYGGRQPASLFVFRHGTPTAYTGPHQTDDILQHLRALAREEVGDEEEADVAGRQGSQPAPLQPGSESAVPAPREAEPPPKLVEPALLPLTPQVLEDALEAHPLLLILFYDRHRKAGRNYLLSNFSAAAETVVTQNLQVKLGWMQVRFFVAPPPVELCPRPETSHPTPLAHATASSRFGQVHAESEQHALLRRDYEVRELPDMKLFVQGQPYDYQASADVDSILDVVRWNAGGRALRGPASRLVQIEGPESMGRLWDAAEPQPRLVLVSFTTLWCTRCLETAPLLAAVAELLAANDTTAAAVTVAILNIDDPRNQGLVDKYGVLAFPRQKVFWRGRIVLGDFPIKSGTAAREIANELVGLRQHLMEMAAASQTPA